MDIWSSSNCRKPGKYDFVGDEKYENSLRNLLALTHKEFDDEIKRAQLNPMEEFDDMIASMDFVAEQTGAQIVFGPPCPSKLDSCIFISKYKNRWDVYHEKMLTEGDVCKHIDDSNAYIQFICPSDRISNMFGKDVHLFVALLCDALQIDVHKDEYNVLLRYMSTVCRTGKQDAPQRLLPVLTSKGNRTWFDLQKAIDVIVQNYKHDKALFPLVERIRNMATVSGACLQSVIQFHDKAPIQHAQIDAQILMENNSKVLLLVNGRLQCVQKRNEEIKEMEFEDGIIDAAILGYYFYIFTKGGKILSNNPLWQTMENIVHFSASGNAFAFVTREDRTTLQVVKFSEALVMAEFTLEYPITQLCLLAVTGNYVRCEINGVKTLKMMQCNCNGGKCSKCKLNTQVHKKLVDQGTEFKAEITDGVLIFYHPSTSKWKSVTLDAHEAQRCTMCGCANCKGKYCAQCKDTDAIKMYMSPAFQKNTATVGDFTRFFSADCGYGDGYVTALNQKIATIDIWHLDSVGVTSGKETTAEVASLERIYRGETATIYVWEKNRPFLMDVQIQRYLSHNNKYVAGTHYGPMFISFEIAADEILQFQPLRFLKAVKAGRNTDHAHRDYALKLIRDLRGMKDISEMTLANFHIEDGIVSENLRDMYSENPYHVREACIIQHRRKLAEMRRTLKYAIEQHNKAEAGKAIIKKRKRTAVVKKTEKKAKAKMSFLEKLKKRRKKMTRE